MIIYGPRLVQTQAALNEAVCVIPRIQGSEVFVLRSGSPAKFAKLPGSLADQG